MSGSDRVQALQSGPFPTLLLHVHCSFEDNVYEWVTLACDGTGPADESKRTKRVQGWSRQNWLGGILIIVSLYI